MPRIAFVGAGSAVFTRNLVGDVLSLPELRDTTTFALMDIDANRLATAEIAARRLVEAHGARASVEATQDRRAALAGADYVVTSFQVGGYRPATVIDFEVPKRYGLRQTIADTIGVGGIMRGLRTIPVLLDVCRDLEELTRTRSCSITSTRWRCCAGPSQRRAPSGRSGCATRCSTPPPSSPLISGCPPARWTTASPGSTTSRSSSS